MKLFAFAVAAFASVAACAVAVGCARAHDQGNEPSATTAQADDLTDGGRRVCPSKRYPDGGWVKVDGLDTSDYDYVEWDAAMAGSPNMKFGFTRVSAGLIREDTRFGFDWPEMKRVGLIRGAYQYFKPSQSAIAQADYFLQRLADNGGLLDSDFPPVLDFETTNGMPADTVVCRVKLWLTRVERATKRLPIVYASAQQDPYLAAEFARYPLWVPNYVQTPSQTCPMTPNAWPQWTMWQWGGASLPGVWSNGNRDDDAGGGIAHADAGDGGIGPPVPSDVDVNYFDGTLEQLVAFVASTQSDGGVADAPLPAHPPHVLPDAGISGPLDCDDGCCVIAP